MNGEPPKAPSPASTASVSLGITCSVLSIVMLAYSFDYLFVWMPKLLDVFQAVKVRVSPFAEILSQYGRILWGLVALSVSLSIVEAVRHQGRKRTVVVQVTAFAAALILVIIARHGFWTTFVGLFQGVGTAR